MNRYVGAALGILAAVIVPAAPASAQNFPDHPVKIIVPYPAGGPADTVARVTTQGLGAELGGNVIIENLAGAGGRLATKDVPLPRFSRGRMKQSASTSPCRR